MSEEVKFVPYEEAKKIIGNIVEEEHIHELNRQILTVYDLKGKELCWFDAAEVLSEVGGGKKKKRPTDQESEEVKLAAVEYIMHRIPEWVVKK